jgi:hypothetical protein
VAEGQAVSSVKRVLFLNLVVVVAVVERPARVVSIVVMLVVDHFMAVQVAEVVEVLNIFRVVPLKANLMAVLAEVIFIPLAAAELVARLVEARL